jgi:Nif-specific regulatory protein
MPPKRSRKIRERESELPLLFAISQTLDTTLDLRDVASPVLKLMAQHMGMLHGTMTIFNRETGEINILAAHGLSGEEIKRGVYKFGEGVTGMVVKSGKPAVVPQVSKEPLFLNRTGARKRKVKKEDISFICVPIKVDNEVIGSLSADRLYADDDVSLEEDVRLLSIIASMLAQSVKLRQKLEEERLRLVEENTRLQNELKERFRPSNLIGNAQAMQLVYERINQVCKSDTTALIRGESGVGKELVAHAIHHGGLRSGRPYVKVNCAALPETVIESELFGHEKGAFTGATTTRKGRFELANNGTLFLDEIGDLSPATQVKLLRVLQEGEFERVGGTGTIHCNVRIIAATNRNLEEMIETGTFRQDLYYRLNVFPLHIPPLRERRSDIVLLADHFVEKYARDQSKRVKRISTPAIDMLNAYHWPGNVRELENCIEHAVLVTNDEVIHGHHLPPSLQTADESGTTHHGTLKESLAAVERDVAATAERLRPNSASPSASSGSASRPTVSTTSASAADGNAGDRHLRNPTVHRSERPTRRIRYTDHTAAVSVPAEHIKAGQRLKESLPRWNCVRWGSV